MLIRAGVIYSQCEGEADHWGEMDELGQACVIFRLAFLPSILVFHILERFQHVD